MRPGHCSLLKHLHYFSTSLDPRPLNIFNTAPPTALSHARCNRKWEGPRETLWDWCHKGWGRSYRAVGLVPQHATRAEEEAMGLWDWCHNMPQGLGKKLWGCGTGATMCHKG